MVYFSAKLGLGNQMTTPDKPEFLPTSSGVLTYLLVWLRGFHVDREKSKAADWAMVVLTFFTLLAAALSAVYLRGQLNENQKTTQAALKQVDEARRNTDATVRNFEIDERAWMEVEIARHRGSMEVAMQQYDLVLTNMGKTVARGVSLKVMPAFAVQDIPKEQIELDISEAAQKLLRYF